MRSTRIFQEISERDDSQAGASSESRTPFERDRDRILYSSEFRRLSGVTQVVSAIEGDVFHNRLTHSLKVAQVGRRVAERLTRSQSEYVYVGLPDVVETAGLAHDLGHPPFGHDGEETIDAEIKKQLDEEEEGFEGNAQSFRIVTRLAVRSLEKKSPGLNLTRASTNAILKYPWLWKDSGTKRKWGSYGSEREYFEWARTDAKDSVPSIEAQLMDWADDVTYATHDMEDFYRAGLIPLERLTRKGSEVDKFVGSRHCQRGKLKGRDHLDDTLVAVLAPFALLDTRYDGGRDHRILLRRGISALIASFTKAVSIDESGKNQAPSLDINDRERIQVELLKQLTTRYVIEHPRIVSIRKGQRLMLRKLFEIYLEAISRKKARDLALLPQATQDRLDTDDRPERLTADLLASMTERQVIQTYQRLTGLVPGFGSHFDV